MKYKIIERADGRYQPVHKRFLLWRAMDDFMGDPADFSTRQSAYIFITRFHCNWLNATARRVIKWGRSVDVKVKK